MATTKTTNRGGGGGTAAAAAAAAAGGRTSSNYTKSNYWKNKQQGMIKQQQKLSKEERREKYTKLARERSFQQRHKQAQRRLICFHCRQRGHGMDTCPQMIIQKQKGCRSSFNSSSSNKSVATVVNNRSITTSRHKRCCYKCGSLDHRLALCPQIIMIGKNTTKKYNNIELPFAICFICQNQGHLANQCPNNDKGIYVNGGSCKTCGSKFHLSKECPAAATTKETNSEKEEDDDNNNNKGLPKLNDEIFDDLMDPNHDTLLKQKMTKRKVDLTNTKDKKAIIVRKRRVVKF